MTTVTFSVCDKERVITKYDLNIQEESIGVTHIDASSVWDEFTVHAEWGNGNKETILPNTYSNNQSNELIS